mmetsp:Transcript_8515/g.14347  ORF Transcript_8515/g.14347 Transcript_8515/m.14347 type:complete len:243 (-) Transcript_8515:53-781(-)
MSSSSMSKHSAKQRENKMARAGQQIVENTDFLKRIKELEKRLEVELAQSQLKSKSERKDEYKGNIIQLYEKKSRKWLFQRGKGHLLDFTDDEIRKLKECFSALDDDGSGSIGIDELEDPLIGLGFADSREEVLEMIEDVDEDGSGMIEFEEFLLIIKNSDANEKTAKINQFFKDMSNGKLGNKDLSFNIIVQQIRRGHMMNAILEQGEKKEGGMRILTNVEKQIKAMKERVAEEEENSDEDD